MFKKVLVANRGEIALRVVRACRELGIQSVVVHSTRDAGSAAVLAADQRIQIGPPAPRKSYLNAAAVLEAALQSGAEAIHPGYGFLSEDAEFAEACEAEGLTFIGPPAAVIERLGAKVSARSLMSQAGLPLLPGSLNALEAAAARGLAERIGFPVIVKASAGGGGRGMTVIRSAADFDAQFRQVQATARMLFGDGRVYMEKYLESARHVEIQVLVDGHGNGVHLGGRDCTMQRRYQKLIEESPVPGMPAESVKRLGAVAVRAALLAGYEGVGTFEFLLAPDGSYYFMEVNCRIQVEHPVTEMVTGIDLIHQQLRVAAGEPLGLRQEEIASRGVSIECRINAEDPERNFAPTPGRIDTFVPPGGPFVRIDTHVRPGDSVPPDYDSLLAKLVVWAPDRDTAIARMLRALHELQLSGANLTTTRRFLATVVDHPAFRGVTHDTTFLERELC